MLYWYTQGWLPCDKAHTHGHNVSGEMGGWAVSLWQLVANDVKLSETDNRIATTFPGLYVNTPGHVTLNWWSAMSRDHASRSRASPMVSRLRVGNFTVKTRDRRCPDFITQNNFDYDRSWCIIFMLVYFVLGHVFELCHRDKFSSLISPHKNLKTIDKNYRFVKFIILSSSGKFFPF